jgi:predicted DNA-binding protein YlxM (UPF0122 family)
MLHELEHTVDDATNGARWGYVDDQPLGQIAADLGVTVSAVSQRLSTIHKKLAAQQERIWSRFAVA